MERGVSIGERVEADPRGRSAGLPHRALTERILKRADRAGPRAALIDAADGTVTSWRWFAGMVRAAAHGLSRRGLAEGDAAGVLVGDAASFAIAVNAVRAAGAIASPILPDAGPAGAAGRLNACGARVLITSAPLARAAAEAADRSRVRQVFAFGEAAGTTPVSSLLAGAAGDITGHGPAVDETAPHGGRDVVVAGPPCGDGDAYTSLLDLVLLSGGTVVAAPVPLVTAAVRAYRGTAAIVPGGTDVPGICPDRIFIPA